MAQSRGPGGVSSRPGQKNKGGRDPKFDPTPHIKEVYDRFAEEELPDQLKNLIARLGDVDDEGKA